MIFDVEKTVVLKRLPEFLRKVLREDGSLELLEILDLNSINVIAALMDKIIQDLGGIRDYNTWSEFEQYIDEFKLPEVFESGSGFYMVDYPELLKGFFAFKGTEVDLQYLLKIIGFEFTVIDNNTLSISTSFYSLLQNHTGPFQNDIEILLSTLTEQQIDELINTLYIWSVNNTNPVALGHPLLVVNQNRTFADALLDDYGIVISPEFEDFLDQTYLDWQEANEISQQFDDCEIFANLTINLDSPAFEGYRSSSSQELLRSLMKSRMSPCTFLRGTNVDLLTKDNYGVSAGVNEDLSVILEDNTDETFDLDDIDEVLDVIVNEIMTDTSDNIIGVELMPPIGGIESYMIDNQNPYMIKGNDEPEVIEENLYARVPVAFLQWTPVDDGSGNASPASYPPVRRGMWFEAVAPNPLNTPKGTISDGYLIWFDAYGDIGTVIQTPFWTPSDDGTGDVDPTSYPPVQNETVRVSGLPAPLNSPIGLMSNGDLVYFDQMGLPSLTRLI